MKVCQLRATDEAPDVSADERTALEALKDVVQLRWFGIGSLPVESTIGGNSARNGTDPIAHRRGLDPAPKNDAPGGSAMRSQHISASRWTNEANVDRYRKLLNGHLTDLERRFVERRLAEEQQQASRTSREEQGPAGGLVVCE